MCCLALVGCVAMAWLGSGIVAWLVFTVVVWLVYAAAIMLGYNGLLWRLIAPMLFWLVVVSLLGAVTSAIVVTVGDVPAFRTPWLTRWRQHILHGVDRIGLAYRWLDLRCPGGIDVYVRWLIPLGYIGVVTFCFCLFVIRTVPLLTPLIPGTSWHWYAIVASMAAVYAATAVAMLSDPGIIDDKHVAKYPNNNLIFFDGRVCHTCDVVKPARSKHCRVCGHCIAVYDHHCHWINNCVGGNNYRWFLVWLLANQNFLTYGFYLCARALIAQPHPDGYWRLIVGTTERNKVTGMFVILCGTFSVVLAAFFLLHLRYIYLGVTTNEADKWGDIEWLVRLGLLYRVTPGVGRLGERYVEYIGADTGFISLNDEQVVVAPHQFSGVHLEKVTLVETQLVNIYDRGFWHNLRERVWQ